jgi:deoxyuridine 5'-triphosphate nucleotidohydrolase
MFGFKKPAKKATVPVRHKALIVQSEIAKGLPLPSYARKRDAGMDIPCAEDIIIPAFGSIDVRTGIHLVPPEGFYFRVVGKGSSGKKKLYFTLENIDADYTGEVILHPCNSSAEDVAVKRGQCIAAIVLTKLEQCEFEQITANQLPTTDRGAGRMNSSGRGLT